MKDFKFSITIKGAEPEEVFNALTNPIAIELWSGYPAVMELKQDSEFSLWEGDIEGRIIDFELNTMISQEWFFGESEYPSVVTIRLFPKKSNKTYVVLTHTNIPKGDFDNITEGWTEYYLGAIKKFFEEE